MNRVMMALTGAVLIGGVASAKTVALWPIEQTAEGKHDMRCVIDSANDFEFEIYYQTATNVHIVTSTLGWALPPNPDTERHAYEPVNKYAAKLFDSGKVNRFLVNAKANGVSKYLKRTGDFTVEGWINFYDLPSTNQWSCIFGAFDDDSWSRHRWTLSLRQVVSGQEMSWIFWAQGGSDKSFKNYATLAEAGAITNQWMHLALVHTAAVNNSDAWKFYIDGVKVGEVSEHYSESGTDNGTSFDLGARGDGKKTPATFDYWRVSDKALSPEAFLCAGESGSQTVANPTVAYWPLEATATGGVDGRDAVGNAPLTSGFHGMTAMTTCRMGASDDCAFVGNPPNSTVTLSGGNNGCMVGSDTASCLMREDLGAYFNLSTNFTVEGWFSPRICERTNKEREAACYVFGTRYDYGKGWAFQYRQNAQDNIQFDLYCVDQQRIMINNVKLSGSYDMNGWYDAWHHLALVYDCDGGSYGYGRWTLYIDGAETGHADNWCEVSPVTDARPFFVGGRKEISGQSFQGKIDCVRICQADLSPSQFLNATEGATAATDVLAFWPLNVENGYYLDLNDVSGNNKPFTSWDTGYAKNHVVGNANLAPTITNPDRSPNFRGDPTTVNGCALFRDVGGSNQHKSYLITGSTTATGAVGYNKNYTFECYYYRNREATDNQEVLFATASGSSVHTRFFRKSTGIYIWESISGSELKDTLIPNTSDADMPANVWHHIALVHDISSGSVVWTIFVDGVMKGSATNTLGSGRTVVPQIIIGGRYWSDNNSVNGYLSSVRLSNRALTADEFLCGPAPTPKTVATAGYWPIDSSGNGLANLVSNDYPFAASGTAAGSDDAARGRIPNTNALAGVVTGENRRNHGSYALGSGGVLTAPSVGYAMALNRSFTLEGWIKHTAPDGDAEEDLAVAGSDDDGNVRLYIETVGGVSRLKVKAQSVWPSTPFVEGDFGVDLSQFDGKWTHLAIVYDQHDGTGSWTLYANDQPIGEKVKNFYYPTSTDYFRSGALRLGSTDHPLNGSLDMWRLTEAVVAPSDMLYADPVGMILFFN